MDILNSKYKKQITIVDRIQPINNTIITVFTQEIVTHGYDIIKNEIINNPKILRMTDYDLNKA